MTKNLFTKGESNTQTLKAGGQCYQSLVLHLAPAQLSGYEVCASRSIECTKACLNVSGRGRMSSVQIARVNRTQFLFKNREEFKSQITKELVAFIESCGKLDLLPTVRMNGTSDIVWENFWPQLYQRFPTIQFYDYTKHRNRCLNDWTLPDNYHLTFSRSENNEHDCKTVLEDGKSNVAVVFSSKNFPNHWLNYPTYSAEVDDLRFLDPKGGHVGCLYAKGEGKKDRTGCAAATMALTFDGDNPTDGSSPENTPL